MENFYAGGPPGIKGLGQSARRGPHQDGAGNRRRDGGGEVSSGAGRRGLAFYGGEGQFLTIQAAGHFQNVPR